MSLRRARPLEDALRAVRSRATQGLGAARRRRPPADGSLGEREQRRLSALLDACLEPRLGDVVARARAADVAERYLSLDARARVGFFELLAERAGPDPEQVNLAVATFEAIAHRPTRAEPATAADVVRAGAALRAALRPNWERLFRLLCSLEGGVKLTVDLRADLLAALAAARRAEATTIDVALLGCLDDDLRAVLRDYVDVGLLQLHHITWDTPASFLEKLIRYEAVHAITSWADLKNRLRADRRCYAFVHPGLPDEPLIFVEVALVVGLSDRIGPLLDLGSPLGPIDDADTAIFYSISSCQDGLAGISLGDFLIKRVVAELRHDLPGLRRFATLSPLPGFRAWLQGQLRDDPAAVVALLDDDGRRAMAQVATLVDDDDARRAFATGLVAAGTAPRTLPPGVDDDEPAPGAPEKRTERRSERDPSAGDPPAGGPSAEAPSTEDRAVAAANGAPPAVGGTEPGEGDTVAAADPVVVGLAALAAGGRRAAELLAEASSSSSSGSALRPAVLHLAAHYLTNVRRDGHAADRVAHFHLSNGARIERVNWAANPAPAGLAESLGVMVNYSYDPDRIEANHTDYVVRGRIATSSPVSRLGG